MLNFGDRMGTGVFNVISRWLFVPGSRYIYQVSDDIDSQDANAKLIIGALYILIGMAILGMCLNLMQEQIVVQVRTGLRRIGLIRPARFDDLE